MRRLVSVLLALGLGACGGPARPTPVDVAGFPLPEGRHLLMVVDAELGMICSGIGGGGLSRYPAAVAVPGTATMQGDTWVLRPDDPASGSFEVRLRVASDAGSATGVALTGSITGVANHFTAGFPALSQHFPGFGTEPAQANFGSGVTATGHAMSSGRILASGELRGEVTFIGGGMSCDGSPAWSIGSLAGLP
ncbi:MAG TPA: hypothetical protein VF198_06120 [Vicinamibacterales bacterium]